MCDNHSGLGSLVKPSEDQIFDDIEKERFNQIRKWGDQRHPHDAWVRIELEEFGEVAKSINECRPWEEVRAELIQVAAVAVAWISDIDRRVVDGEVIRPANERIE